MHVCPYACFVIFMYVGFKSSSEFMLYVASCTELGVYYKRGFEISMVYQKRVSCGHQERVSCFSSRIHLQLPVLSLHVFNLKVLDVFF
jgi:hypothetical protein